MGHDGEAIMEQSKRTTKILEIRALELLTPTDEGVELNEGYEFDLQGAMPQVADGLAKLFIELNADTELGENAGDMLLTLVIEYYNQLKND